MDPPFQLNRLISEKQRELPEIQTEWNKAKTYLINEFVLLKFSATTGKLSISIGFHANIRIVMNNFSCFNLETMVTSWRCIHFSLH